MTEQKKQLGAWLSQIADELNITDTSSTGPFPATEPLANGSPTALPWM